MFQSHGIIGSVVTAMTLLTSAARVAACTVFFTYDGTLALAGDNEDWGPPIRRSGSCPRNQANMSWSILDLAREPIPLTM